MAIIRPFKAIRPKRDKASLVASRSYVTYSPSSLKDKLNTNPYTFLHIINPDYMEESRTSKKEKYHLIKRKFQEFIEKDILFEEKEKNFYVYEQTKKNKKFIGIIGSVSIDEYLNGNIRLHEETIAKREKMFKDYLDITRFNADPILLTYRDNKDINKIINKYEKERAEYDFTTTNRVHHKLWKISNKLDIKNIIHSFQTINNLYIADGHHRSASSALLLKERRKKNNKLSKEENVNYCMSYLIAESQIDIINFNRLIKIDQKLNILDIINEIEKIYHVKNMGNQPYSPTTKKEISMYVNRNWYSLTYQGKEHDTIAANLDPSILSNNILSPILNIKDERTNKNIHFIDGTTPLSEVQKKIDNKEFDIAFVLQPMNINNIKDVANNQETMPPKSTYIQPKLRSGLTIYRID